MSEGLARFSKYIFLCICTCSYKCLKAVINVNIDPLDQSCKVSNRLSLSRFILERTFFFPGKHMFPNEWIAVSQPRGNEVIKVFDGYPGRESQDGKDNNK